MILGLINPAWVRFTRLETRKSVLGVGIGSLALLSIVFFTFYSLLLICGVVSWLMIFGLYNPTWVRFTRLKTRGAIFGVGMGIIVFSMPIAFLFVPEEVKQEMIAKEAEEKARQDRIALERELAQKEKDRIDSIREAKEKARRDSIALEKARRDSIRTERAKQQLSAARSAYDSGNFKNAIASAQEATSTLKSIRNIPEASTLNDEAKTLLADAKEAFANVPKFILSADQLYQEYENNEIAADNKYKGKIVLISGKIQNISKDDIWNTPIIIIGSELFGVRCHLERSENPAVARLSKGQRVSVKGEVKGKDFPYVHVKNCTLQ